MYSSEISRPSRPPPTIRTSCAAVLVGAAAQHRRLGQQPRLRSSIRAAGGHRRCMPQLGAARRSSRSYGELAASTGGMAKLTRREIDYLDQLQACIVLFLFQSSWAAGQLVKTPPIEERWGTALLMARGQRSRPGEQCKSNGRHNASIKRLQFDSASSKLHTINADNEFVDTIQKLHELMKQSRTCQQGRCCQTNEAPTASHTDVKP